MKRAISLCSTTSLLVASIMAVQRRGGACLRDKGYIARVALPFFCLMMAAAQLMYFFPGIITWPTSHM